MRFRRRGGFRRRRRYAKKFRRRVKRSVQSLFPLSMETRGIIDDALIGSANQGFISRFNLLPAASSDNNIFMFGFDFKNETYGQLEGLGAQWIGASGSPNYVTPASVVVQQWSELIDFPSLQNFYNTSIEYSKWCIVLEIPSTTNRMVLDLFWIVAPLLPIESNNQAGTADLTRLRDQAEKFMGESYLDRNVPKRLKPQHHEWAIVGHKRKYYRGNGLKGGFISKTNYDAASALAEAYDSAFTNGPELNLHHIKWNMNFRGKMRFYVSKQANTWIPQCTVGASYFFWGKDRTTPVILFPMAKLSGVGIRLSGQGGLVGDTVIPASAQPANVVANPVPPPQALPSNGMVQNYGCITTSTMVTWYRNESPGTLSYPTTGPS